MVNGRYFLPSDLHNRKWLTHLYVTSEEEGVSWDPEILGVRQDKCPIQEPLEGMDRICWDFLGEHI